MVSKTNLRVLFDRVLSEKGKFVSGCEDTDFFNPVALFKRTPEPSKRLPWIVAVAYLRLGAILVRIDELPQNHPLDYDLLFDIFCGVLSVHLDPDHYSHLFELLFRAHQSSLPLGPLSDRLVYEITQRLGIRDGWSDF